MEGKLSVTVVVFCQSNSSATKVAATEVAHVLCHCQSPNRRKFLPDRTVDVGVRPLWAGFPFNLAAPHDQGHKRTVSIVFTNVSEDALEGSYFYYDPDQPKLKLANH